jgi:hypothetical protein
MITRRCSERRFFLRPDEDTNNAFIYCLALAATRPKVQVTFSVAMSNHHHTGIHDPDGTFPEGADDQHRNARDLTSQGRRSPPESRNRLHPNGEASIDRHTGKPDDAKVLHVHIAEADLFALHAGGTPIAVTTNGLVGRDGLARLGAGCAHECGRRFPWFSRELGRLITTHGLHTVQVGERIIAFPVERDPYQNPELALIESSARELVALADREGWDEVALARPGCGHGGLDWKDVAAVLAPILDHRFQVVTLPNRP